MILYTSPPFFPKFLPQILTTPHRYGRLRELQGPFARQGTCHIGPSGVVRAFGAQVEVENQMGHLADPKKRQGTRPKDPGFGKFGQICPKQTYG